MNKTIPQGWKNVKLGNICKILRGKGLSKDKLSDTGKNKCILYGELFTTYSESIKEVKSRTDESGGTLSMKGDILIPSSTTTTGVDLVNAVVLNEDGVLLGGDVNILRKKCDSYNSEFLAYYLTHIKKDDIIRLTQGITIVHLYGKDLKEIELLLPPKDLQNKIVEIIETTDEAIRATNKIINESERIKNGLIKDLLTNGLPFNNRKKQETEIGQIPEDWRLVKQGDVAKFYNGRAYKLSEWEKSGIPVIRQQNLTEKGSSFYYSNLSLPKHQYCKSGDLLYMWSASFGPHIWDGPEAIYHYHIWKIECSEMIEKMYLFYLLNRITLELQRKMQGGTMSHITKAIMEKHLIGLPPISEQRKIIEVLNTIDSKIKTETEKFYHLLKIKKGILQKLLTGQIPVRVD